MCKCNCHESTYELITMDQDITCIPDSFKSKEFIKEQKLNLPDTLPNIEKLEKVIIKPKITSYKTICTPEGPKLIIKGKIIQKIFYFNESTDECMHCTTFKFPFYNFIKLNNCICIKDIKVKIEDVSIQISKQRDLEESILLLVCIIPQRHCCNCNNNCTHKPNCDCNCKYNDPCKHKCGCKSNSDCYWDTNVYC